MPTILQIDFTHHGPFGRELSEFAAPAADDIAAEPGLRWKIWTENAETGEAGGLYLFDDEALAKAFREKQTGRLEAQGMTNVRAKIFAVNEALTATTRGPVSASATKKATAAE